MAGRKKATLPALLSVVLGGTLFCGPVQHLKSRLALRAEGMDKWRVGPGDVFTGQAQKVLYLMQENPTLFDSAMEQELEILHEQRENENEQKEYSSREDVKEDTLVLRKRIEEVKHMERTRVVTELLYLKVLGFCEAQRM